jgi:ferritin-like protein
MRRVQSMQKIARRIDELGGTETGDPTEFVMLSPLKRFSMPSSTSDVKVILLYILEQKQDIIEIANKRSTYDEI